MGSRVSKQHQFDVKAIRRGTKHPPQLPATKCHCFLPGGMLQSLAWSGSVLLGVLSSISSPPCAQREDTLSIHRKHSKHLRPSPSKQFGLAEMKTTFFHASCF